MGKYFLETARHGKAREFLELKQGMMTVLEYVTMFIEYVTMWPPTWTN